MMLVVSSDCVDIISLTSSGLGVCQEAWGWCHVVFEGR